MPKVIKKRPEEYGAGGVSFSGDATEDEKKVKTLIWHLNLRIRDASNGIIDLETALVRNAREQYEVMGKKGENWQKYLNTDLDALVSNPNIPAAEIHRIRNKYNTKMGYLSRFVGYVKEKRG